MLSTRYFGQRNAAGGNLGNIGTTAGEGISYTQQPVNIIPLPGSIGNQGPTGAAGGALGNASFYQGPQVADAPRYIQHSPPPNVINKAPHIDSPMVDGWINNYRERDLLRGPQLPGFV